MFTQFFGNYLLNKGIVSAEKLSEALSAQKNIRLKLGVLAINAGLMTAEQVDAVHNEQQRVDKRIGDLMVEMGYVTREQVEELFKTQPSGHLLLGQALVDSGTMTNAQFEAALQDYKAENGISDADFNGANDEKTETILAGLYELEGSPMEKYITGYIALLFKNIIRFIGDDFTPVFSSSISSPNYVSQKMNGAFSISSAIVTDNDANIEFASRFAGEKLTEDDDYADACVSEFLNLHNGLFAVNLSNETGKELQLEPQENTVPDFSEYSTICEIPVCFSFGTVKFIIAF